MRSANQPAIRDRHAPVPGASSSPAARKFQPRRNKIKMKKIIIPLFIIVYLVLVSFACGDEFDFRQTKWGMTQQQVIKSENGTPIAHDNNNIYYETRVLGRSILLSYEFINNNLIRTVYSNKDIHTNLNEFISDYEAFKEVISKKYGEPKLAKTMWKNELYKNDPENYGLAVSVGHLAFGSIWETDRTDIQSTLSSANFKITHLVVYTGKDMKKVIESKESQEAENNF